MKSQSTSTVHADIWKYQLSRENTAKTLKWEHVGHIQKTTEEPV